MAYDATIIDAIKRQAQTVADPRKRDRYVRAALQTGIVESGLQNLNHGDADSEGWRQERKSLYPNPTNVSASVKRFFAEAEQHDHGQPSWELAADVQRPAAQFRGRYKDVAKEAAGLLGGGVRGEASDAQAQTPGQTTSSSLTTGGDVTVPTLPEREKPAVTGPALPDYVRSAPVVAAAPGQTAQQGIRAAIAALGKVPESTTTETTTTPASTTTPSEPQTGATKGKGSKVLELIFNDGGKGYGIKNGQVVDAPSTFSEVWDGHADHVHAAAGPKTIVALGKYAQKLGLNVGENPSFGGVDVGAHVAGSYHGKAEAIDVSGDPKKMKAFAKYVAAYNNTRALPA